MIHNSPINIKLFLFLVLTYPLWSEETQVRLGIKTRLEVSLVGEIENFQFIRFKDKSKSILKYNNIINPLFQWVSSFASDTSLEIINSKNREHFYINKKKKQYWEKDYFGKNKNKNSKLISLNFSDEYPPQNIKRVNSVGVFKVNGFNTSLWITSISNQKITMKISEWAVDSTPMLLYADSLNKDILVSKMYQDEEIKSLEFGSGLSKNSSIIGVRNIEEIYLENNIGTIPGSIIKGRVEVFDLEQKEVQSFFETEIIELYIEQSNNSYFTIPADFTKIIKNK
tara:strand:- start:10 stop:858 length:849 start_codon:yes stop_codon:yes gene_type:complete